jgi:NTP pyrophosphatase (non-canonical NTP hydrolase)
MTLAELVAPPARSSDTPLAVVLCGSFRRDPDGLRDIFGRLAERYVVLSPSSVEFVDCDAEFVRLAAEQDECVDDIESRHLAAMREADAVWLFCPNGYVGTTAALEIGYAHSVGIPVLTDTRPQDEVVAGMVSVVSSVDQLQSAAAPHPGAGLAALQCYYQRIAERRGWAHESPRDTLLLLTEELGELARAVRKEAGLRRDGAFSNDPIGDELADVQLYLVHLATALGVDLADAVTSKERANAARHEQRQIDAA